MMSAAIAAAVLASMLGVAQAPAQTSSTAADLAEARRLINAGDARGALARLRATAVAPDSDEAIRHAHLLGVAHYHADEPAKAIEILAPITDRLPVDSIERREADQVLGLSYFIAGRFADAVPRLEATRKWASENLELGNVLGQAYIRVQRADDARQVFASVYRVPPDSAAAHLIAAQMMVRLEMEAMAEAELKQGLAKDPRLPHANFLLGQMALFRGRLAEAIALTEREIAINPSNGMAFAQLGDAYTRQSAWDAAIGALQKSIWLNPYYSA
ncbi:MAG TPA: tetratricopeptide repeat protein, partial [Vicinamibacterales bacterium]|nr:tetratricopeptide repeat protein [Vicinamibacterales bacterium]